MEDKSTSTDEKPTKNYKDKLYVREYMRNYMNDKYSVVVTCETCGKHEKIQHVQTCKIKRLLYTQTRIIIIKCLIKINSRMN